MEGLPLALNEYDLRDFVYSLAATKVTTNTTKPDKIKILNKISLYAGSEYIVWEMALDASEVGEVVV